MRRALGLIGWDESGHGVGTGAGRVVATWWVWRGAWRGWCGGVCCGVWCKDWCGVWCKDWCGMRCKDWCGAWWCVVMCANGGRIGAVRGVAQRKGCWCGAGAIYNNGGRVNIWPAASRTDHGGNARGAWCMALRRLSMDGGDGRRKPGLLLQIGEQRDRAL